MVAGVGIIQDPLERARSQEQPGRARLVGHEGAWPSHRGRSRFFHRALIVIEGTNPLICQFRRTRVSTSPSWLLNMLTPRTLRTRRGHCRLRVPGPITEQLVGRPAARYPLLLLIVAGWLVLRGSVVWRRPLPFLFEVPQPPGVGHWYVEASSLGRNKAQ